MSGDQADGTGACIWSRACSRSWSGGGEERKSGSEETSGEMHSDLSCLKFYIWLYAGGEEINEVRELEMLERSSENRDW